MRTAATLVVLALLAGCVAGAGMEASDDVSSPSAPSPPVSAPDPSRADASRADASRADPSRAEAAPAHGTLLAINGTELFVRRVGAGDPILVVHGGPVLDHGYLVEPLRPLADAGHELVFHDQRLSGRSAGTVDSASVRLDTLVQDIEALRASLGLERVHLLGHSWGGLLALKYALAHPDRLRSLVLVSPMPPSAAAWREEQAAMAARLEPADTAGMGALRSSEAFRQGDPAAIERLLQLSFRAQLRDRSLADALRFHIGPDYRERSRRFALLGPDLGAFDLTGAVATLAVPTLVVYGGDEVGAASGAELFRRVLPDASVVVIERAGHFVFLERPGEFRRLVGDFLAAH